MSNATYTLGTVEYVVLEIEATAPGFTFTPADWTAKVALVEIDAAFSDVPASWTAATLEQVDGKNYAKVLLGATPILAAGKYRGLVRLTKTVGGTEIPLLNAVGVVTVKAP